ncbi:bifunctional DNA primase/helicase, partial [Viscerimonas tarda]
MLNKDEILKRTNSGLDVFKHCIAGQWRVGRNFFNPLYEDRKASCNIYYDRRSQAYKMKDFGNDAFSGDCFDIVGKIKGLDCNNSKDFIEILQTINRDLSLGIDENDTSFVVSVSTPDSKPKKQ